MWIVGQDNVNDVIMDGRVGDAPRTLTLLDESIIDVIEVPLIIDVEVVPIGVVLFEVTSEWEANVDIGLPII